MPVFYESLEPSTRFNFLLFPSSGLGTQLHKEAPALIESEESASHKA
jgi:hypothetical protein